MEQKFKCDVRQARIEVRKDRVGNYYSDMDDILDVFPGAASFQVGGEDVDFLQDQRGIGLGSNSEMTQRSRLQERHLISGWAFISILFL